MKCKAVKDKVLIDAIHSRSPLFWCYIMKLLKRKSFKKMDKWL